MSKEVSTTSRSLALLFINAYSDKGLAEACRQVGRRLFALALPAAELALIFGVVFVAWAAVNAKQNRKHSAILHGKVGPDREPPRDIMKPHFFQNKQGLWLHYNKYWHESDHGPAKGVVVLLHGHSEHHRRFIHVIDEFNKKGFVVFGMDHQGFGRSEGDRGHVEDFEHYPDDVLEFMKTVVHEDHKELNDLPKFLAAHSMGGLIAIHTALRAKASSHPAHKLSGLVLSAPAIFVDPKRNSMALRVAGQIVDLLFPKAQLVDFPSYPSTTFLQVKKHATFDPLNYHEPIRIHQGLELLRGTAMAQEMAPSFDYPILIFHGRNDLHASVDGSKHFFTKISSQDSTLVEFTELKHEPWQEEKEIRHAIVESAVAWALDRVKHSKIDHFEEKIQSITPEFVLHKDGELQDASSQP